jgi:two-component system, sensor histidine kinase and response regulator
LAERHLAFWKDLNPEYEITLVNGHAIVLRADRERLRQIIDNLISNAVGIRQICQACHGRGETTGETVRIHVKDEGPGIPPEQLPNIFNRFERVPGQGGRGHGLGLYIAAALARLHGGVLTVESEVGKGALFALALPCARPDESTDSVR